ncbi:MAG: hypothetical protein IT307_07805 [Chloroflexi bacterium]|nr:hypothetical protein [Chloroflexota bacterium]
MRRIVFLLVMMSLLAALRLPATAHAQTIGPDGTPQVDASSETLAYSDAAIPEMLVHYGIVIREMDALPQNPGPDQVKTSPIRKRLLDLRLTMDFNAYLSEPGLFAVYRDAIDAAYEELGEYKDLFDTQAIDGAPINPAAQDAQLARMNLALAPLRLASFREDMRTFFSNGRRDLSLFLEPDDQPRLWQLARSGPTDRLDSAGNAARLGELVLTNLRSAGLVVDNIFDTAQEQRFHDIRKALRSILVLCDMFPSLSAALNDVREPLDDAVSSYGKVNDLVIAYHAAQITGRNLDQRTTDLRTAYTANQDLVRKFLEKGQLDAYIASLRQAQSNHQR